jgi:hypothetical protein
MIVGWYFDVSVELNSVARRPAGREDVERTGGAGVYRLRSVAHLALLRSCMPKYVDPQKFRLDIVGVQNHTSGPDPASS